MKTDGEAKSARLLSIYAQLQSGKALKKTELAEYFGVSARSIQRDIEALRCFLADRHIDQEVVLDRKAGTYRLVNTQPRGFTNGEILAVCKILLESRSMRRDELLPILDKLVDCCVPEDNKRAVLQLLANEKHHYIEPHHGVRLTERLWGLGEAVRCQLVTELSYRRGKDGETVTRTVEPVGVMFSEYYFYLVAFIRDIDRTEFENPDDLFPTIYRVDRIQSFRVTDEHFRVPYLSRFEEGEFRKRVQFMYGGKLQTVRFRYVGPSVEAVLDRLPTAEAVPDGDGWIVTAEVFGKGIEMWMRSQGEWVEMEDDKK